ncbi:serine hydrolase [Proteus terrae]|uniref:serine-type D-Ala-D-Ala carboxypeptidase n=1 Tax=Proteus terrae subsp. cibarius TaxID=626774 RepID=A0A8I1BND0_9GAMM|nr:serine hydrolase [Proteus terrae]QHP75821.1 serine-type D-Ala-D-Ala carboxypeptidase [Proteus vulgaris]MBG2915902.1 serine hydrolase [Proteus terrae subsp. cibarius]QKD70064.1 serine-type D-Ala-D-Ala carboxypeptidase [Proteus terrae subsp. cibarius]QKD71892.1 serine-type D-Ala-D-Ala carboxypeptidase [Proteus terrae subsp. cibarius]QUT02987.1 serine hydrolase [Proteus terrae subsp. cibarius]
MKKNIPSVLGKVTAGMGLLLIISSPSFAVNNPVPPQIEAKSYVLMDYNSGKILASEKPDERLDPASLTKIMSSYVVGQAIKEGRMSPDDTVIVGRNAWATGNPVLKGSSLMFLKPGDQVKVIDLNRGMVIQSGNDASIALAEHVAGSQETFVDLMNSYANKLGLKNTHFKTVHGLDSEGQYTTAQDMALLTVAMIRDVPSEYEIHKEKEFTFNNIRQPNRNRLLWNKNMNVDGVKTGHTNGAGYNLVSSATEGNMRLIAVVLGTPSDKVRFAESEKLLGWGFRFFETVTPVKADTPLTTQKVWYGDKGEVSLGVANDASITIPKGELKNLKASFTLTDPVLEAPLTQNQVVGTVNFLLNDEIIEQRPLVVKETVKEGGFFSRIWDFVVKTVSGWFNAIFG